MKLEYNKDSNVGIAPFGYDPRSKLIIKKNNMTLNEIFILETGNETFADNCEKIADDYAIEFGNFIERIKDADIDSIEYHSYLNNNMDELLEIFKKEKGYEYNRNNRNFKKR